MLLVGGASSFAPLSIALCPGSTTPTPKNTAGAASSCRLHNSPEKGAGGMFDTRNPDAIKHEDARKSISEAPTFEEYMKMRAASSSSAAAATTPTTAWSPPAPATTTTTTTTAHWGQPAAAAASGGNPPAFSNWGQPAATAPAAAVAATVATPQSTTASVSWASPPTSPATSAVAGGGDPISVLSASQAATVAKIARAIPDLAPKPDLSWNNGVSIGGCAPTTLDARDAAGPANVAWLASVCVPSKLSSLTIFNGPLTDVPHLLSRCCVINNNNGNMTMMRLDVDFRPRAYGAYDLVKPDGTYPGPDELGRKAFEYSGARLDFDKKFGNDEVKAFLDAARATFEGAVATDAQLTKLDVLTGSPLALSLVMPITNANIAAVATVREQAAAAWLRWTQDDGGRHNHRPGAPINTQYVYDAKFRQNAYSALLPLYTSLFGADDGRRLAAAESGPLDEAYVGGGS
jgi:hypothetical protein